MRLIVRIFNDTGLRTPAASGILGLIMMLASNGRAADVVNRESVLDMQSGIENRLLLVDVRSPNEFKAAHIRGAINVPFERVSSWEPPATKRVVLYCSGIGCPLSGEAANILQGRGYRNVSVLQGGLSAWTQSGYPMVTGTSGMEDISSSQTDAVTLSPGRLNALMRERGLVLLDVRPAVESKAARIPGSRNVPVEDLSTRLVEIVSGRDIVIYDRFPIRTQKAAQLLLEAGARVYVLSGGVAAWAAQGYPLETAGRDRN